MAQWGGKVIGGGIGWLFGGPFGAILGTMAGEFFDKHNGPGGRKVFFEERNHNYDKSFILTTHFVGLLVSVAKADRKINSHEIKVIEKTFIRFGFSTEDLLNIKELINKFSNESLDTRDMCLKYKVVSNYEQRLILLRVIYLVAVSDSVFHYNEDCVISEIVRYLDISLADASEIRSLYININESSNHYEIFGLTRDASRVEIEQAYRNLSKKYHPDKVAHLGDEFSKMANDKFQEINVAYQEIKREKGF